MGMTMQCDRDNKPESVEFDPTPENHCRNSTTGYSFAAKAGG